MRQTLRHEAATIRPILRVLFASVLVLSLFPAAGRANNNAPSRRDTANAQFDRAEKAREALERAGANDGGGGLMEATIDLARAGGTVGEWTDSLVRVGRGRYTPPILETSAAVGTLKVPVAKRKIRIALGKAGLDGHINAIKLLAHACMQAGMEVVLAGFKQTPEQMVATALEEDVDVLAISSLAGAHMSIARETIELLKSRGADEVALVMGGIIPEADRTALTKLGVKAVFTPKDSNLGEIVGRIVEIAGQKQR